MTPRYRETPWTLTARQAPSGAQVWYYYWYDGDKRKGPKSTGIGYSNARDKAKSRKQAQDYCATLFRADRLGSDLDGTTLAQWTDKMRFWDWARSRWVRGILARSSKDRPGITENYVKDGAGVYRDRIEPAHGHLPIDEITPQDCEDLLFAWKRVAANKTVNNWRSYYSTMLAEAERLGVIRENPWKRVQQLSADSKSRGGLTLAEGVALLDYRPTESNEKRYYLASKLAMMTGLRIGEVCGLQTDDIKSKTATIRGEDVTIYYIDVSRQYHAKLKRLAPVKDKDARAVPITADLYAEIEPLLNGQGRYLFSLDPEKRTPLTPNRLRDWFYARCDVAGIDRKERNIGFHSTRRFFNTLLRRRVSGDVLRKMTGHDSDAMTEHYTDYLPEDLAAITDAQKSIAQGV
jgi:integrase